MGLDRVARDEEVCTDSLKREVRGQVTQNPNLNCRQHAGPNRAGLASVFDPRLNDAQGTVKDGRRTRWTMRFSSLVEELIRHAQRHLT